MTLDPKEIVRSDNTAAADVVVDLSHAVWDTPEVAFEEYKTAEMTSRVLADAGFEVETEIADLPTAWSATYGNGELTVTICAELDALPDIGHACGHNVIAAAGVGVGLALQNVADDLGITIRVLLDILLGFSDHTRQNLRVPNDLVYCVEVGSSDPTVMHYVSGKGPFEGLFIPQR